MMKQAGLLFLLIAALAFASCRQTARQTVADVEPDKYDFERGQIYRIVKEFFKKGKRIPQSVYCYFSFE